ncbi:LysR substrate-binding domain-containing protein [Nannocystaceae bacterium ST9]
MQDPFSGIVAFVHVAEQRSFRKAAEQLGLSAAALSKAVAKLEDELGVRLFDRTTRRVEPTAEGELFLEHCRAALGSVREGRELLAEAQKVARGELTLSLPFILGPWLIERLPRFCARYPALRLQLRFTDRFSKLVDEHIDVAIRVGTLGDSSAIARKLMTTRWVSVAAPGYLARKGTPRRPEELAEHECLAYRGPRGAAVDWWFRTKPKSRDSTTHPVDARVLLDQGELLVDAALAGLGVCQVLEFMVVEPLREGRLVAVLDEWAAAGPPVHALCKPGQQNVPKVRALLDFLVESR